LTEDGSKEPDDVGATTRALKWLEQLSPTTRFFMWVHYLGPHSPSTRTPGVKDFGRGLVNEYDHEIRVFDQRVAPLLSALSARQDAGEPLAVIVSADHGEEFAQHRFHGHSVEEGTAHIPLLVSLPGVAAGRSNALVSSVDVFPTVLSLTASPLPGGLDGRDLSAVISGQAVDPSRVVLMDGWVNDNNDGLPFNRVAALGATRRMRWDLLDFAESAGNQPSVDVPDLGEDQRLRATLTDYLEHVAVDPRQSPP
jgi:arylsulfatase A-like enzyme